MKRHSLIAFGSCLLGACGSDFSAAEGAGGVSGGASGSNASGGRAGVETPIDHAGSDSAGVASGGSATPEGGEAGASDAPGGLGGVTGNAGGGAGGSDEQPAIPQLGLALWLRADVGVQQANGSVEAWLDQSGNQRNATQNGSNVRPHYLSKGTNDLPALKFDGQGQFLNLPRGFADFSHGLAGFMVLQPTNSDCASALELSNGSEVDDVALGMWLDGWSYEVEVPFIQSGRVDLLAPSLYAVNHRPDTDTQQASAGLRINGALLQSLSMPLPQVIRREDNFIGHTLYGSCHYFEGTLSEVVLYDRVLTANELNAVETYLEQHWKLGATL